MDLYLVPFRIELHALLLFELELLFTRITKTLIKKKLWDYSTPVVKKNIFNINNAEPDDSPPEFTSFVKEVGILFKANVG